MGNELPISLPAVTTDMVRRDSDWVYLQIYHGYYEKKLWYGGPEAAYVLESTFHRDRTSYIKCTHMKYTYETPLASRTGTLKSKLLTN